MLCSPWFLIKWVVVEVGKDKLYWLLSFLGNGPAGTQLEVLGSAPAVEFPSLEVSGTEGTGQVFEPAAQDDTQQAPSISV